MKASEIFKKYPEQYLWLTKDSDGLVYLWDMIPDRIYSKFEKSVGFWSFFKASSMNHLELDTVDEFKGLDWDKCIICRDDVEETFTAKDMVEFVKWTNVIYRDLSHTLAIKDVDNVNELLELFKQTR